MFNKGGMAQDIPDDMVENVGIMQGFMDEDSDEGYEAEAMDERSPASPEILMNNLRGDMRSMDARVDELATLVGEEAAMGTPTEVLALLQPVLAAQGGIGGLPAGGMPPPGMPPGMPPEMGMPPPEMGMPPGMPPEMGMPPLPPGAAGGIGELMAPPAPQAPPPTAQAPINMAKGGYVQVQRFQEGSGEEGVTPESTFSPGSITPEMLKRAQEGMMAQRGAGNLKQAVEDVLPTYRDILGGGDRNTMQGQALMDIAQAGLALASGRNAQGANVAGGSFAAQLASAAQGLPGKLSERAGQFQQEERAIKLAALKSAESNVDAQRKLFSQIVKTAGQSPFGKGLMGGALSILNNSQLMQKYADGTSSPDETNLVETARLIAERPTTEFYTDDKGKRQERVTEGIKLPHVAPAFQQRQSVLGGGRTTPAPAVTTTTRTPAAPAAPAGTTTTTPAPAAPPVILSAEQINAIEDPDEKAKAIAAAEARANLGNVPAGTEPVAAPAPKLADLPPEKQAQLRAAAPELDKAITVPKTASPTLWEAHKDAVGMHRQIGRVFGEAIPFDIAGQLSTKVTQATGAIDLVRQELLSALRTTSKLAEGERKELENKAIKLGLKFFQNEVGYRNQVIALALDFETREREALLRAKDPMTDKKEKNDQENRAVELASMKRRIGAPPFAITKSDYESIPKGKEFLSWDAKIGGWVMDTKK
jgi:hypothetical protein